MKKIIKKFKAIWNKDCKDILVPLISIIIFIAILFCINLISALIVLAFINLLYFTI